MNIRYATMADLDDIASVESVCFPVLEAATKEEFEQRIKYFGNHFWLMFDEGITDKSTHGNVLWHQMRLPCSSPTPITTIFSRIITCATLWAPRCPASWFSPWHPDRKSVV